MKKRTKPVCVEQIDPHQTSAAQCRFLKRRRARLTRRVKGDAPKGFKGYSS